jgi:hypothetical protein
MNIFECACSGFLGQAWCFFCLLFGWLAGWLVLFIFIFLLYYCTESTL